LRAFDNLQWQEFVSVTSKFYWPVSAGAEAVPNSQQASEVLIEVEGELKVVVPGGSSEPLRDMFGNVQPEFHLRFLQEQAGSAALLKSETVARQSRLITDTTVNRLKTYPTYVEWRDDRDRAEAGTAMFISLALTGGRIIEDNHLSEWPGFEVEQVIQIGQIRQDGSEFNVFEANRVNKNGDTEKWKVWVGRDGLPKRIELTVESEAPGRSVRGAEIEITYSGKSFKPAGIP
jgi:hypothetical protein